MWTWMSFLGMEARHEILLRTHLLFSLTSLGSGEKKSLIFRISIFLFREFLEKGGRLLFLKDFFKLEGHAV